MFFPLTLEIVYCQIMATAYMRNEPWEMGVHKRKGVVYLDVHKLPERPRSERDRRMYYSKTITFLAFYYFDTSLNFLLIYLFTRHGRI